MPVAGIRGKHVQEHLDQDVLVHRTERGQRQGVTPLVVRLPLAEHLRRVKPLARQPVVHLTVMRQAQQQQVAEFGALLSGQVRVVAWGADTMDVRDLRVLPPVPLGQSDGM